MISFDPGTSFANSSPAILTNYMIRAMARIPNLQLGRAVFYMNRTAFEFLDIQRLTAVGAGGGITYQNVDGMSIPTFRGIPIRKTDAILLTEGRVT